MTGCQKKQTVVLPEKEQKEEATEIESKNKETQEISFDEELPKDYEGTLTMWGWDTDYYQTVTQAFQKIYPNVKALVTLQTPQYPFCILPLKTKICQKNMKQH